MSWSKRMEEAREARARVLAARGAEEQTEVAPPDALPKPLPETELERAGAADDVTPLLERLSLRAAVGILAGATLGAVIVMALLPQQMGPEIAPNASDSVASAPVLPIESAAEAEPSLDTSAPIEVHEFEDTGDGAEPVRTVVAVGPTASDLARAAAARGAPVSPTADSPSDAVSAREVPGDVPAESAARTTNGEAEQALVAAETAGIQASGEGGNQDAAPPPSDVAALGVTGEEAEPATEQARPRAPPERPDANLPEAEDRPAAVEPPSSVAATVEPRDEAEAQAEAEAVATTPQDDVDATAPPEDAGLLFVHAAPRTAPEEFTETVALLGKAGFTVAETVRVDFRISSTNVRYFHQEDAELAGRVAEIVSGTSRDFTTYRPLPDPGTVEVWLEG